MINVSSMILQFTMLVLSLSLFFLAIFVYVRLFWWVIEIILFLAKFDMGNLFGVTNNIKFEFMLLQIYKMVRRLIL